MVAKAPAGSLPERRHQVPRIDNALVREDALAIGSAQCEGIENTLQPAPPFFGNEGEAIDPRFQTQGDFLALFESGVEARRIDGENCRIAEILSQAGGAFAIVYMLEDEIRREDDPAFAQDVQQVEVILDVIVDAITNVFARTNAADDFAKSSRHNRKRAQVLLHD